MAAFLLVLSVRRRMRPLAEKIGNLIGLIAEKIGTGRIGIRSIVEKIRSGSAGRQSIVEKIRTGSTGIRPIGKICLSRPKD